MSGSCCPGRAERQAGATREGQREKGVCRSLMVPKSRVCTQEADESPRDAAVPPPTAAFAIVHDVAIILHLSRKMTSCFAQHHYLHYANERACCPFETIQSDITSSLPPGRSRVEPSCPEGRGMFVIIKAYPSVSLYVNRILTTLLNSSVTHL